MLNRLYFWLSRKLGRSIMLKRGRDFEYTVICVRMPDEIVVDWVGE